MAKKMTAAETRAAFRKNAQNLVKTLDQFRKRRYIIGIDPSLTGTAFVTCRIKDEKDFRRFRCADCFKRTTRKAKTQYQRMHLIRCHLKMVVTHFPARLVLIEGYSYNKMQNREVMGEVGHAIRDILWSNPDLAGPCIVVAPTQLKKYIAGQSKNVPKDKVILNVYKKYGVEVEDNDEADALVLAALGHDLLTRFVDVVGTIPTGDADLIGFLKSAHVMSGLQRHQWEVIQSLVTNKCDSTLYDFFNTEDWFGK